jgi:hypothetical protein
MERQKGRKGKRRAQLRRYWNWKRKNKISFSGELVLEEVMDLSQDRLRSKRILYPDILTVSLNELQFCT